MRFFVAGILFGLIGFAGGVRAGESTAESTQRTWSAAIDFLLKTQKPDGFWAHPERPVGKTGITGIILEALVQAPDAVRTPQLEAAMRKAADWIASQQRGEEPNPRYAGAIFDEESTPFANYSTSVAVTALAKYDRERFADVIARAVPWIKKQQANAETGYNPEQHAMFGGFGYGASQRPDLSNTWMALEALKASGLVEDDDPLWADARVFLHRVQNATEVNDRPYADDAPENHGGGIYVPGESAPGMGRGQAGREGTPPPEGAAPREGGRRGGEAPTGPRVQSSYGSMTYALMLSYLWVDPKLEDPGVALAADWLARHYTLDKNPNARNEGTQGLYYYYRVMAKCLTAHGLDEIGGNRWADDLVAAIEKRQQPDGSFVNNADRWMEDDPHLVTGYALSALALADKARQTAAE